MRAWRPTQKKRQTQCRKGSPRTLQSRAFVQEGLQKSLNPRVAKKHRKLHQNASPNGAKSHQRDVLEPPREGHKNRRRKASLTDPKRPPKGTPKLSQIQSKLDSGPKKAQKKGGFLSGASPLMPKVTKKHQKRSHNL